MDPWVWLVLGGGGMILLIYVSDRRQMRKVQPAWREAADRLKAEFHADSGMFFGPAGGRIEGTLDIGSFAVTTRNGGGEGQPATYTRCRVVLRIPPAGLRVRAESLSSRLVGAIGFPDLQTGDAEFDACVLLAGAEGKCLAVLDADTRMALRSAIEHTGWTIEEGAVMQETGTLIAEPGRLVAFAQETIALARRLSLADRSVPELLEGNAKADPEACVRRRNLEVLLRDFRNGPEARRAAEWTLEHASDLEAFALAAAALGAQAAPLLERRAGTAPGSELRAAALAQVTGMLPAERLPRLVAQALGCDRGGAPGASAGDGAPTWERIAARLPAAAAPLAAAAVAALARAGDPAQEPALFAALGHADLAVRCAAARALGQLGTVRAVEPLLACGHAAPLLGSADLRTAVRDAVKAIQGRLPGAEAGRISLLDSAAADGALSLADEAGRLSVAGKREAAGDGAPGPARDGDTTRAPQPGGGP